MAYCSDIKPHKLIDWVMITRAEDIQKSFIRGGPPRGPTPYPFIYHFFKKRHPFRIPFIGERHPVPRPPPFLNTPTRPASILSGTRSSLLIEIFTGTYGWHGSFSHKTSPVITSTGIVELNFLKHGCPRSK